MSWRRRREVYEPRSPAQMSAPGRLVDAALPAETVITGTTASQRQLFRKRLRGVRRELKCRGCRRTVVRAFMRESRLPPRHPWPGEL